MAKHGKAKLKMFKIFSKLIFKSHILDDFGWFEVGMIHFSGRTGIRGRGSRLCWIHPQQGPLSTDLDGQK